MSQELTPPPKPQPITSPHLDLSETADTKAWDTLYPPANRIDDPDVLDDWLERVDQALADSRNGVMAISWPLAMASFLAILLLLADAANPIGLGRLMTLDGWVALVDSNPGRVVVGAFLITVTGWAIKLANEGTAARKLLVQIRASYLRRRRAMGTSATK